MLSSMASLAVSTLSFPHLSAQRHSNYHIVRTRRFPSERKPFGRALHFVVNPRHRIFSLKDDDSKPAQPSISSDSIERENPPEDGDLVRRISRTVVCVLFCVAAGIFQARALPAAALPPATKEARLEKLIEIDESKWKGHEYSGYTRNLLKLVSNQLLPCVKKVRNGSREVKELKAVLKKVKERKETLQDEIMGEMFSETKRLRAPKKELVSRLNKIVDNAEKLMSEFEDLRKRKERITDNLEKRLVEVEKEYGKVWEIVEDVDYAIRKAEIEAMSCGVRELCFIERECEELVKTVAKEVKLRSKDSTANSLITKQSRSEIQRELETAQRMLLEQMVLPKVVEANDPGPLFGSELLDFAEHVKQGLQESRELQQSLEARIRETMRKYGEEKKLVVKTPEDEVVKGFPELELKWMFGEKEVVVPSAMRLHLYHGWKKWREEAKGDLKRKLLEDVDFGKRYVAEKQETILLDRDRVVSRTWYNDGKKRWEMDPEAVPYAVSKKLVEHARIRHDWGAMYITMKGDEKEYYINAKEYETLHQEFGGFDGLYMKMLANDIPTTVHLMWIPLSELNIHQQFLLAVRLARQFFVALWKNTYVTNARRWISEKIEDLNEDILVAIVCPLAEFLIPHGVRIRLGMAWPEETDQSVGSSWYLGWLTKAQRRYKYRNRGNRLLSLSWFCFRIVICGYILLLVPLLVRRKVPKLLGFGPILRDPVFWKFRRVKAYMKTKRRLVRKKRKNGVDPIKTAFEQMKVCTSLPILLLQFSSRNLCTKHESQESSNPIEEFF
ncbi:Probable inactive ATP-dependent zinc metalloprotease FTSHI 5, chloroplastic [Linum grandiflorum]